MSLSVECICLRICVAPYRRNSREWLHSTVSASAQVRCKWRHMTNEVPMFGKAAPSSNSLAVVLTGVLSAEGAHPKLFFTSAFAVPIFESCSRRRALLISKRQTGVGKARLSLGLHVLRAWPPERPCLPPFGTGGAPAANRRSVGHSLHPCSAML